MNFPMNKSIKMLLSQVVRNCNFSYFVIFRTLEWYIGIGKRNETILLYYKCLTLDSN